MLGRGREARLVQEGVREATVGVDACADPEQVEVERGGAGDGWVGGGEEAAEEAATGCEGAELKSQMKHLSLPGEEEQEPYESRRCVSLISCAILARLANLDTG